MLYCIVFDELALEDSPCSRSERSQRLSAFLLFPTGCMHGKCDGRIAWPHCIQVTLSVVRSTASYVVAAVSVCSRALPLLWEHALASHKTYIRDSPRSFSLRRGNLDIQIGSIVVMECTSVELGLQFPRLVTESRFNPRSRAAVTTQFRRLCGIQRRQRTAQLRPKLAWSVGRMAR